MSIYVYNTAGLTKTVQVTLSDDDKPLLQSFLLVLQHLHAKEYSVTTAVYSEEAAYVYIFSKDENWGEGIPC